MASKFLRLIRKSYEASCSSSYIERLCSSWLLSPVALFALRATISLYAFTTRFTILGYESTHGMTKAAQHDSSYFTDLGYWGIAFYFAFTAAHTASYAFRGRAFLESWPNILKWLHSALYATITVYPFIVTGEFIVQHVKRINSNRWAAVFWAILANGAFNTQFNSWSNISEHALNSVFAFLEIFLPRSDPHPWLLLVPIIVVAALYLALAYISHATEHFWVYNFLDPQVKANGSGLVAGACIGILVGMIVVFIIVHYLIWFRNWITEKKLGLKGKLSKRGAGSRVRDEEEMAEVSTSSVRADEEK